MKTPTHHRARIGLAAGVLAGLLTGCAAENSAENDAGRSAASSATPPAVPSSEATPGGTVPTETSGVVRIRLIIGDRAATATLENTAPARDFAAMLPVTISMRDLLGREKPGRLPRQLDIADAPREYRYEVGEIAYWAPGNDIAIFYANDGQSIPRPGLVRIGTIDTGLEVIAAAGEGFQMRIEPLD
jgi:hypothetical protein